MNINKLNHCHVELIKAYDEIAQLFKIMNDEILYQLLGEKNKKLLSDIKKHGDGYPLRSVPRSITTWEDADIIVLFAMNFPLLNMDSVFDPFCSLVNINYWWRFKNLANDICKKRIQYMVLEQVCGVSGENDAEAKRNRNLLERNYFGLKNIFENAEEKTFELLKELIKFQADKTIGCKEKKPFIVFTNRGKSKFDDKVNCLLNDKNVIHINETNLYGKNHQIMEYIKDCIREY